MMAFMPSVPHKTAMDILRGVLEFIRRDQWLTAKVRQQGIVQAPVVFMSSVPHKIAMDILRGVLEFIRVEQWLTAKVRQQGIVHTPMEFMPLIPYKTAMGVLLEVPEFTQKEPLPIVTDTLLTMMGFLHRKMCKIAMDTQIVMGQESVRTDRWPIAMGFLLLAMGSTQESSATALGQPQELHLQRTELRPLLPLVVLRMVEKTLPTNI